MPYSKLSPAASSTRQKPASHRRSLDDGIPMQSVGPLCEVFSPPPIRPGLHIPAAPRHRTPTRCKMGALGYETWQGSRRVTCAVPKLRLSGRWLEACGFSVGDELQVSVDNGVLRISKR